jgi:hypothetical protein
MKENIGFYSQTQDIQPSIESACRGFRDQLARKRQDLALILKKHLATGLAAGTIGILWYVTILLFFRQLAEYGW